MCIYLCLVCLSLPLNLGDYNIGNKYINICTKNHHIIINVWHLYWYNYTSIDFTFKHMFLLMLHVLFSIILPMNSTLVLFWMSFICGGIEMAVMKIYSIELRCSKKYMCVCYYFSIPFFVCVCESLHAS